MNSVGLGSPASMAGFFKSLFNKITNRAEIDWDDLEADLIASDLGILESVYSEALQLEFKMAEIPYEHEKMLKVFYEDQFLNKYFRADFVCYKTIIIELKAIKYLSDADRKQTLNNVKATKLKLGLLINFGTPSLTYYRVVN